MVGGTHTRLIFKHIKDTVAIFGSTTAGAADSSTLKCNSTVYSILPNDNITLHCLSGDIHIEQNATATTNSFKLITGTVLDLKMPKTGYLSVVSTSTSAAIQGIVWE